MKYTQFTDLHIGGPLEIMTYDDLKKNILKSPFYCVLTGDIFDLKNCPKRDVTKYTDLAKNICWLLSTIGSGAYVRGNHELNRLLERDFVITEEKHYWAHFDRESWGLERSNEFRAKKPGAGWFKRTLISPAIEELRHMVAVRPSDQLKASISDLKKKHPGITHITGGHSHPINNVSWVQNGVNCQISARGMQIVDLAD